MKLELTGSSEVSAPREVVWQRLIDPRFVAQSAPAIESVEVLDPTHFRVTSGFGIGRMKARVTLEGELFDLKPDTSARMRMRGTGPGSAIDVLSTIAIRQAGTGKVRLEWTTIAELKGTLAKVGVRMLEGIAHNLTDQFWVDFARRVAEEEGVGRVL
jgi:carbon monoxide dehydrogenase subunit G